VARKLRSLLTSRELSERRASLELAASFGRRCALLMCHGFSALAASFALSCRVQLERRSQTFFCGLQVTLSLSIYKHIDIDIDIDKDIYRRCALLMCRGFSALAASFALSCRVRLERRSQTFFCGLQVTTHTHIYIYIYI